jgi:hypothetical protein
MISLNTRLSANPVRLAVRCAVACALFVGSTTAVLAADAAPGAVQAGPVRLTFGGFTALETVYRDKNETADIGSNFNSAIPFDYQANAHVSEFRETARQSRFSLLAQGPADGAMSAEGYMETDFLSSGTTSNSNESNSYTLRVRHFYGVLRNTQSGWFLLGGQTWSLATLDGKGLNPRSEVTPATIDAQYATGFDWTRNPQLRLVKTFGDTAALGISFESPQAQWSHVPSTTLVTNTGGSLLNSGANYAIDFAPDVIVKAAFDPGFGHYEVYGMARGFRDRTPNTAAGVSSTTWGSGIGAGMVLPLGNMVTFQLSGLAGSGIGRYGTSGLPDVTVKPDGTPATISESDVLAGLTFKPTPLLSIYVYAGMEQASRKDYVNGTAGAGYGSALYLNTTCASVTGSASTCAGDTKQIEQFDIGEWWKMYQGPMGNFQFGAQYSYTKRELFADVNGVAPSTNINMVFISFRYYPYQR